MTTVAQEWNMRCPSCEGDNNIIISALVSVKLCPDGTDDDETFDGHEWDKKSPCRCSNCDFSGQVSDFEIPLETHTSDTKEG